MPIPPIVPATLPSRNALKDLYPGIRRLLMGRTVADDTLAEALRKGILELTEDYKFEDLQVTGPVTSLIAYQPSYFPGYFMAPNDPPANFNNLPVEKVNSFFIYMNAFATPGSGNLGSNTGYNLKYRTIDVIETLINIPGVPIYWSRFNGFIWLGSMPDSNYNIYMRYQKEHPFPNAGRSSIETPPTAGDDLVWMPRSWQDICEYMGAMRAAQELNLSTKVSELNARLYGDAKFQKTGGIEGQPGLIFQRTSQENRDQTTSRKSFRLRMTSV